MNYDEAREISDGYVSYFNGLARLAEQSLLIPEARSCVLVALEDPYLTLEQEAELFKRYEAALFSEELLKNEELDEESKKTYEWIAEDGRLAALHLMEVYDFLAVAHALQHVSGPVQIHDSLEKSRNLLAQAVERFDYTEEKPFAWWIAHFLATRDEG